MIPKEKENGKVEVGRKKSENNVAALVWLRKECEESRDIIGLWKNKLDKQIGVLEGIIEKEGGKL